MPPRDRQRMAVLHDLPMRMRMPRRVPKQGRGPKAGSNPGVWVWESVFKPGRRIPSLVATGPGSYVPIRVVVARWGDGGGYR